MKKKTQKQNSKLTFKKFQVAKINNAQAVVGGNPPDDGETIRTKL